MEAISIQNFSNNIIPTFDRAKEGENIYIQCNGELYALVKVDSSRPMMTPELRRRSEEARNEYLNGNGTLCSTKEDIENFLNSL